jgi:hypothetical protein
MEPVVASAETSAPVSPARRRRNPLAVAAIAVVVVSIGAMWVYAFFFASKKNPDQIADRAWTQRAKVTCTAFKTQIDALPGARSFKDVQPRSEAMRERAAVGAQVTDLLDQQLAALRAEEAADETSRHALGLWLADWDRYLAARRAHILEWEAGKDVPFKEPPTRPGQITPVSVRMDAFADINFMPSCEVPKDMG